jgi:IS30 family transposase
MRHHQSGIADALNRDKSTISREVSRSPVLLTLAERRTRYSTIAKAPDKSAQAVTDALLTALQPHADLVHTLTYDGLVKSPLDAKYSQI